MELETPEVRELRERITEKVKSDLREYARTLAGAAQQPSPPPARRHEDILRTNARLDAPPRQTVARGTVQEGRESDLVIAIGAGAFNRLTVDGDGHTWLQGGTVSGGNGGSHTFANYKVIDFTTGPVETEDSILLIKVECEATVANGQMLPGCKVTAAGAHAWDTDPGEVPDNHSFTTGAATGFLYYEVGRWSETAFLPAAAGSNLRASGCIGDFLIRPLYAR